jgi:O-antigen ligase
MSTLGAREILELKPVRRRVAGSGSLDPHVVAQLSLAVACSLAVGLALALTGGWKAPAALVALIFLTALGLLRPRLFLGLFLLLRPITALISTKQLVPGVASANADGLTAILLLVVLFGLLVQSKLNFRPRAAGAMGLMLGFSAVAAVYAYARVGSRVGGDPISEFVRLATLLAMYLLAANLFDTPRRTTLVLRLLSLSAIFPATFGVIQWATGAAPYRAELGISRISSTLGGGSNTLAAYLAACGLILISGRAKLPRWLTWGSLLLVLTALVGTYSREGWLIFLLGTLIIGWRRQRVASVAVIIAAVALTLVVPSVRNRVLPSSTSTINGSAAASANSSFEWRLNDWNAILGKYVQSPLVGFGLGTETYVNPYIDPYIAGHRGWNSHNSLLTILIEGGVILLIPWLLVFGTMMRTCRRLARTLWELRDEAALALALWMAIIVASLVAEDALDETTLVFVVLAITGSIEGARRTRLREDEQQALEVAFTEREAPRAEPAPV